MRNPNIEEEEKDNMDNMDYEIDDGEWDDKGNSGLSVNLNGENQKITILFEITPKNVMILCLLLIVYMMLRA